MRRLLLNKSIFKKSFEPTHSIANKCWFSLNTIFKTRTTITNFRGCQPKKRVILLTVKRNFDKHRNVSNLEINKEFHFFEGQAKEERRETLFQNFNLNYFWVNIWKCYFWNFSKIAPYIKFLLFLRRQAAGRVHKIIIFH